MTAVNMTKLNKGVQMHPTPLHAIRAAEVRLMEFTPRSEKASPNAILSSR